VAEVQQLFRFSPENCAQGTTSELVHCCGATPNSGSSTTKASSGVRLPSNASELLRKTPCLLSDHVERIRGGLYLASQEKTNNITFMLGRLIRAFFGRGDTCPTHCDD